MHQKTLVFLFIVLCLAFGNVQAQNWSAPSYYGSVPVSGSTYYLLNVGTKGFLNRGGNYGTQAVVSAWPSVNAAPTNVVKWTAVNKSGSTWSFQYNVASTNIANQFLYASNPSSADGSVFTDNSTNNTWNLVQTDTVNHLFTIQVVNTYGGYVSSQYLGALSTAESTNKGMANTVKYNQSSLSTNSKWKFISISDYNLFTAKVLLDRYMRIAKTRGDIDLTSYVVTYNNGITADINVAAVALLGALSRKDVSTSLTNASFEVSGLTSWSNSGNFVSQSNVPGQGWSKNGTYYCEKWTSSNSNLGAGSISQTVGGLANGIYSVVVSAHAVQQGGSNPLHTGAFLTAGSSSVEVSQGGEYTIDNLVVSNGVLTLGYSLTGSIACNWTGFDNFRLYYYGEIIDVNLQAAIDAATALYKPSGVGAAELLVAIENAKSFLTSTVVVELGKATSDLKKATKTYAYANATASNPIDMTGYMVNPGFDDNTTTGWTGGGTVDYHVVEYFQKTYDLNQNVKGLPSGKYRIRMKGFERSNLDNATAYKAGTEIISSKLYAKSLDFSELSVPLNSVYQYPYSGTGSVDGYVFTMQGAEILFANAGYYDVSLPNVLLNEGQTLQLGVKSSVVTDASWVVVDNFKLEYIGPIADVDRAQALKDRVKEAQKLLNLHLQASVSAKLNAAIVLSQNAASANPIVRTDVDFAKASIDTAINLAYPSIDAFVKFNKEIEHARLIYTFLDKEEEKTKLQTALTNAQASYDNLNLSLAEITIAKSTLVTITRSVGKKIYIANWQMGDVYNPTNNWSIERSKQSKNWILFWEPGFGEYPSGTLVDDCLNLAERAFQYYADTLKFINRATSKTNTYKMVIRLRYSTEWEATGSGVDNTIGLLTLTSWALVSRGGQTVAHEVGHCFQYQTHCDNNDNNGWSYGFGQFWEMCAQWQAYQILPEQHFNNEWFNGYLNNAHRNPMHEDPRYNNFFIQDYWTYLHGLDFIGKLWNKSYSPEDPIDTYKRLNAVSQTNFNEEMWDCAARFATWDIPALKTNGSTYVMSRSQPKMNNQGSYVWRIDSTACPENYGHNIIRLNAPLTAKTMTAYFEGKAGTNGYKKNYLSYAGWRMGFLALLKDGTRVYGTPVVATMTENGGKKSVSFDCPANCDKVWFVVSGAPTTHFQHPWDGNNDNDEQWPYQVAFNNTNLYGYVNNVVNSTDEPALSDIAIYAADHLLTMDNVSEETDVRIYNSMGQCVVQTKISDNRFTVPLEAGVYIVNLQIGTKQFSKKVIVR